MKKNTYLLKERETVNIESAFNYFTTKLIKAKSLPTTSNQSPPSWEFEITAPNSSLSKVIFEPRDYITPTEAVIQRVILGLIKEKIDLFDTISSSTRFEDTDFSITLKEVSSRLGKTRLSKAIHSTFYKLSRFNIEARRGENPDDYIASSIIAEYEYISETKEFVFRANKMFQVMREDKLRQNHFEAIVENTGGYRPIFINLNELFELKNQWQKILLHYFIVQFEATNCQRIKPKSYFINNEFVMKVLNKDVLSKNDLGQMRKTIDDLMAMPQYKKLFAWSGRGRLTLVVTFQPPKIKKTVEKTKWKQRDLLSGK